MGKEAIILGVVGIIIGITIYIKTAALGPSLVPILLGFALILFNRDEETIEKRQDK